MKKTISLLLIVALLCCTFMVGCGGSEEPAATDEGYSIGILAPAVTHGWVAAVAYNAEQRCQELGLDYNVSTSENAEQMTTQLEDFITQGIDAIIAFPQWEGMEVPIQQALDAGIVVVNFDIDIACEGVYKVTGDNYDMGVQGANYIFDKIGAEGVVVTLPVPGSGSVSEQRMAGFNDTIATLEQNWTIKEYATEFTREAGLADFADVLTANPQIDAVYSLDDETSIGVLQAIKESGRTDVKVITGGGGCQEWFNMMPENESIWLQSALYSPAMVKDAVDMAISVLDGEEVETPLVIPTSIVDKDNVADYLDENSPY